MKIVQTADLHFNPNQSETEKLWIYNGLDCCVTYEVRNVLRPQLDSLTSRTYDFERALQGPVLEMRLRGVRIDFARRASLLREFEGQLQGLERNLNRILREGLGISSLNWRSPLQLKTLLYETLGIPTQRKRGKVTTDRDTLEKLQNYFHAQPIIGYLLACRDLAKKIGFLRTEIDADGRLRTSFNIAGTNTGRFSSNLSDFGTGTNLQNIEDRLREIVIADPGYKFAYIDLEQAESRLVGAIEWNLFHDGTYLDACESGDLHTSVCRLAWPNLGWKGDLKLDKAIAEQPFYRQHSYRHMAKVLGHGTNYRGTPRTMAQHTKIDQRVITEFQAVYFKSFPAHLRWHAAVATELATRGYLISTTGRRRYFFGRRDDQETIRSAVAFDPQGSVGDILNRGMLQVWLANICQLLLQIHDAILVQYPEELENEIVPKICELIQVDVPLKHGRVLRIPSEAKVGWNWGAWSKTNPDGLRKFNPNGDPRQRTETVSILDRVF